MAGIIRASEKRTWSAANWAYWGLMDHVIDAFSQDPQTVRLVEECKWMQCLSVPLLREDYPESAEDVVVTLKSVAERCASGDLPCKVEGRLLDDSSQWQFREAMHELVSMLREEDGGK